MKIIALLLVVSFFFIACQSSESAKDLNSNSSPEVEKIRVSENSNGELTEAQKNKLDSRIPPKVREILDNAKEIMISYYVEENTTQLKVVLPNTLTPNAQAKVSNANVKKEFLDSFYQDSSVNYNGAACFSPRHRVKAEYKTKIIEIDICYECENFRGESSLGDFGGAIAQDGKSSALMNEIIKKYGAKIK